MAAVTYEARCQRLHVSQHIESTSHAGRLALRPFCSIREEAEAQKGSEVTAGRAALGMQTQVLQGEAARSLTWPQDPPLSWIVPHATSFPQALGSRKDYN